MNHESLHSNSQKRRHKLFFSSLALTVYGAAAGIVIFVTVFSDMLLNRFAKEKIETVFAEAFPGYALRIGSLHYNIRKNYTECLDVSLAASDSSLLCSAGSFAVDNIGWKQLIMQCELTPGVLKRSVLTASDVSVQLPVSEYVFHCGSIRVSIPDSEITGASVSMDFLESRYRLQCGAVRASAADSELSAEAVEFTPLAGDDDFFSVSAYRRTRVSLSIAQWYLRRTAAFDLLRGRSFKAGVLDIFELEADLFVNRSKPLDPKSPPPLMPAETLARIGCTVRLDSLRIHDARLAYGERVDENGKTGILTFDSVQLSAFGIGSSSGDTACIRARGQFMKAGTMSLAMKIPMTTPELSCSYSGSLTGMDCTVLNRFLEPVEHTRVTSGRLHDASFDVRIARRRASGRVRLDYSNLYLTVLDKKSGSAIVIGSQIQTLFANLLQIRGSNTPDESGSMAIGRVSRRSIRTDSFMNVVWFSLRSGVGDVIGF